jgi:ABC-2 type transport system ATP-binding protein
MTNIIEVQNLTKKFKTRTNRNVITGIYKPNYKYTTAVENLSLSVKEGQSLAFLGPNGAGKTTTTKMLTGLMYPSSGGISVLGFIPQRRERNFLMQIGLVMGNKNSLSWDLTGQQNLDFIRHIYDIDLATFKNRLSTMCTMLNVEEHLPKQIRRLSLGERMKMELIAAIIHQPKILFLDEPTIGLDITSKKTIRHFLRDIQKNLNITLLLTSHDMDDIEQVCDRVVVINNGRKVHDGELRNLMDQYNQTKFIRVFFDKMPGDLQNFGLAEIESVRDEAITFKVKKSKMAEFLAYVTAEYSVLDIDILAVPLEEIIEDIFKQSSIPSSVV